MTKTPLEYGRLACDGIMAKMTAQELWPVNWFFYIQGVFLSGMERVYKLTGEQKYFNYIKAYVDNLIGENGGLPGIDHEYPFKNTCDAAYKSLRFLDCKQPSILLYNLYDETGDEKYLNAIKKIAQSMHFWPVNKAGGYWHMMTQHDQMWLDGAYMAGPLSVMYAQRFGDTVLRERAINQIFIMDDHMKDEKTGLYFRGWDESFAEPWADEKTGCSPSIWGRAVGWYAVAILDIMDYIPKEHPAVERLQQIEKDLLKTLVNFQHKDTSMWYQVLDKPYEVGNWKESSCTNLFIYSYAKAARLGIIDYKTYDDVIEKAFSASIATTFTDENGRFVVANTCEGTCIDEGTYEHYINRKSKNNDLHGCGAFVLMCTEMEKYRAYKEDKARNEK